MPARRRPESLNRNPHGSMTSHTEAGAESHERAGVLGDVGLEEGDAHSLPQKGTCRNIETMALSNRNTDRYTNVKIRWQIR